MSSYSFYKNKPLTYTYSTNTMTFKGLDLWYKIKNYSDEKTEIEEQRIKRQEYLQTALVFFLSRLLHCKTKHVR